MWRWRTAGFSGCFTAEGWIAITGTTARRNLPSGSSCLREVKIGMTLREQLLCDAAQTESGLVRLCMPVPPPAERDLRSGAQVARSETLARVGEAGASIRPVSPAGARVAFYPSHARALHPQRREHPLPGAAHFYQLPTQSSQKTAVDDPLLEVPPARRGNRVSAPLAVPLAKRGEPKGGGQFINSERAIGI